MKSTGRGLTSRDAVRANITALFAAIFVYIRVRVLSMHGLTTKNEKGSIARSNVLGPSMFLQGNALCTGHLGRASRTFWNASFYLRRCDVKLRHTFAPATRFNLRIASTPSTRILPEHCTHQRLQQWLPHPRTHWTKSGFSTASEPSSDYKLVYRGPLSTSIRLLKIFSMTSSITVLVGSPVLIFLGNPGIPIISRIAISSIVCTFGVLTTFMLWWFTRSYVSRMWYSKKDEKIVVNTFSLFARTIQHEFLLKDAGPPANISSFATFKAQDKHYFLHTEVFEDKQLLSSILGAYAQFENMEQNSSDTASHESTSS